MAEGGQKRIKPMNRTKAQAGRQWQENKNKPGVRAKNKARLKARRKAIKENMVKRGTKKNPTDDLHHKDGNPLNNKRSNWEMISRSKNRSQPPKLAARGGRATRKSARKRG